MSPKRGRPNRRSISRRRAPVYSGDIVLIVCEGSKTEPNYFKTLRTLWKLPSAQVEIRGGECRSQPIDVVDFAIDKKLKRENSHRKSGIPKYDQIWCVIDHEAANKPENLDRALDIARLHGINIALSNPCFELWFLLHFKYSTKPYACCHDLVTDLKNIFPIFRRA